MWNQIFLGVITLLFGYSFWKWITANRDYFIKRNIKFIPSSECLKFTFKLIFKRITTQQFVIELYNFEPGEKIIGMFDMNTPVFVLRDLDVIRKIVIKDFDHFTNRRSFLKPDTDRLFGNSLFILKDNKWRDMRATLSPAFTSSKMRQMFGLVVECAQDTAKYYTDQLKTTDNRQIIDVKESFSRFTNDAIATCAFGIKINSFEDRDNEFYKIGTSFNSIFNNIGRFIRILALRLLPFRINKALDIQLFESSVRKFFKEIVIHTMNKREEQAIFRPDMINILMQIRKGTLQNVEEKSPKSEEASGFATVDESDVGKKNVQRKWTDDELVAQAFVFFLAGFDTTATALQFMGYELAINSDIQKRLQREIDEMHENLGDKPLSYDDLGKLTYMDMVTSEVLRKWSPAPAADRECVKDYHYSDGEYNFSVKKDEAVVWVPIWALHHNPEYFPEPEKFDPERFNEENKHNIDPITYLPFGIGPRNCIGSRFALMEIKAIMYYMLLNFNIVPCEKTQIPVKLKSSIFTIQPEKPIIVELKPRDSLNN